MKKLCALLLIALSSPAFAVEPSTNEMRGFYKNGQPDYKVDNALVAAIGLAAPANVTDTYQWALGLTEENIKKGKGLTTEEFQKMPGRLNFSKTDDGLMCWLNARHEAPAGKACYTKQQVAELAAKDKIMLDRFKKLPKYKYFISAPGAGIIPASELISGEKLLLADLAANGEADHEATLKRWMANAILLRNSVSGQNNWVTRSILLVIHGLSLRQLPIILGNDKALAAKYKDTLTALLAPLGPNEMNIPAAEKADYPMYGETFEKLGADSEKKLYALNQELAALAKVPASGFEEANKKFAAKYTNTATLSTTENLLGGIAEISPMIGTMHRTDASVRMHNIYVQLKAQASKPANIAGFINALPASTYDPFTQKPFLYDPKSNSISYDNCPQQRRSDCRLSLN